MSKYNTKQKNIIIDTIKNLNCEFTVQELHYKLGNIGLTTIYRYINSFVELGILEKRIKSDNVCYYEYYDNCSKNNHFYLKCINCGKTIHVDCDCINELYNHINDKHFFKLNKNHIILNGYCKECGVKL